MYRAGMRPMKQTWQQVTGKERHEIQTMPNTIKKLSGGHAQEIPQSKIKL